jgi:hypothetical protein
MSGQTGYANLSRCIGLNLGSSGSCFRTPPRPRRTNKAIVQIWEQRAEAHASIGSAVASYRENAAMNFMYRIAITTNNVRPSPDPDGLFALARRYANKHQPGKQDVQLAPLVTWFMDERDRSEREGICGGMVSEWAWGYLIGGEPSDLPTQDQSMRAQAAFQMTAQEGLIMEEPHARSIAQSRMYADKQLVLTRIIGHKPLPADLRQFPQAVTEIANQLVDAVPFLLVVCPVGGRHAMGVTLHQSAYYVLEPDRGLFRFKNRQTFETELSNFFKQILKPGSQWKLKRIDLAP